MRVYGNECNLDRLAPIYVKQPVQEIYVNKLKFTNFDKKLQLLATQSETADLSEQRHDED
jgi:hypothetical protein